MLSCGHESPDVQSLPMTMLSSVGPNLLESSREMIINSHKDVSTLWVNNSHFWELIFKKLLIACNKEALLPK